MTGVQKQLGMLRYDFTVHKCYIFIDHERLNSYSVSSEKKKCEIFISFKY